MGVIKRIDFVYFITFNSIYLISVHYGPIFKVSISHKLCHIIGLYLHFLLYGNYPLSSKTGGYWNLLESSPDRTSLIKSSHQWNQIQFIISNLNIGIWIYSQPRIYGNSKYNVYGVLTIYHTGISPQLHIL